MCKVAVTNQHMQATFEFKPSQDFVGCMIGATLAALPCFLESFMSCLAGGGSTGEYNPGERTRCSQDTPGPAQ